MPITLTNPGVYIEELSSGVHTITGVATSIAAFVGYTKSGPDHKAKQIFSIPDFVRSFGGLASDSELSYAVQQFFQNGGTNAYIVRVPKNGAAPATVTLLDANGTTGTPSLVVTTLSTGTWSDELVVDVSYDGVTDDKSFNLSITDLATGTNETFNNVTIDNTASNFVVAVVNDEDSGSTLVKVESGGSALRPVQSGTVGGVVDLKQFTDITKKYGLNITHDQPGSPPPTPISFVFLEPNEAAPTSLLSACKLLERKISAALQQSLPGASVSCVPANDAKGIRIIASIPGAYDAMLGFDDKTLPTGYTSADAGLNLIKASLNVAHYWPNSQRGIAPTISAPSPATAAFAQSTATRGYDGTKLPQAIDIIDPAQVKGIYALERVDLFNILCIPDATRAKTGNPAKADLDSSVQNAIFDAALIYCQSRRAFLLIDPPPDVKDVDTAITWASTGLTVRDPKGNAAAYFPRLKLPDPLNNMQLRTYAPCGVIAGLYARIDSGPGVWKAPAGIEAVLNGVQGLAYKLTDPEQGALNPLGLNCSRIFPLYGAVCWGARTIAGADALASEWKYISVRRFALFIEESLYRGTQWVVFEPNDEPLWAQIRLNLGAFMQSLFQQQAFQGKSPQEAYFIKCDSETTTQDDINRGIVNILVAFAPLKPAEFVVIQIQQLAGQIQT